MRETFGDIPGMIYARTDATWKRKVVDVLILSRWNTTNEMMLPTLPSRVRSPMMTVQTTNE